jgi:hypothetical protein
VCGCGVVHVLLLVVISHLSLSVKVSLLLVFLLYLFYFLVFPLWFLCSVRFAYFILVVLWCCCHPLSGKVTLISPTSGGRSVGIVRSITLAIEIFFVTVPRFRLM